MKYIFFGVLLVPVIGSIFITRARNGEPVTAAPRSAAELYSKNCATCHGRDGRAKTIKGKLKHARDLSDPEWQNRVSDERIFNSIMNGKGKMPGYSRKLSEQEINSLVSYVQGLKR